MIERLLYTLLENGLTEIQENPSLVDELFGPDCFELGINEVEAIKALLVRIPPTVQHGYPRKDADFPCYCIVLGSESEDMHFLGHSGGMVAEEGDDYGADIETSIWNHDFRIQVYTEHPDVTVYYYHLAKLIMLRDMNFFHDRGIHSIDLSGTELDPNMAQLPANLFVRQITVRAKRDFTTLVRSEKAWAVTGLAVGGGSESDDTTVKTLVTPYQEE